MNKLPNMLEPEALRRFQALQADAINAVTARFYATQGSAYEHFDPKGREACRQDIGFHLQFLHPALEFGLLQPMVDYLYWLANVLSARAIPVEHVALSLDWLAEFYQQHMPPTEGKIVADALKSARAQFLERLAEPITEPEPPPTWPDTARFEQALLAGDQREAMRIVIDHIDSGQNLIDIEMHIIQPSLYRIGQLWQTNQISVAQEHLATALAQSVMTAGLLRSPIPEPVGRKVLLACVETNHHALGLRMISDAFQLAGWDVQFLGADVPASALVRQAQAWRPDLIGLSVSFAQHLQIAKDTIAQLKSRFADQCPAVIIGGMAVNQFKPMANAIGADGTGIDALTAIADAKQLAQR